MSYLCIMKKYRTPRLDEFIQGFEFEIAKDSKFCFINTTVSPDENKAAIDKIPYIRHWFPMKVWWKHDPEERITEVDSEGNIWNISGKSVNFFKPFDEQSFIDQKLVRVKV